ncbi:MAG: 3'(2'),5'-bisphosphate nucleotidase CysQ [Planctomycetes bacterium]|nr:3'(2'),5'-bisphosphate nucleotidase CysQ [Planctomycetota bacterium]
MPDLLTAATIEARLQAAIEAASGAGRRLVALRQADRWPDAAVLGDVADQAADAFLQGFLRGRWPADGILSEETMDAPDRLARPAVWIVDPLDGTKEYRTGRQDWAVHVGLAVDGEPVLGAVALPALDAVLAGVCVPGRQRLEVRGTRSPAADPGPDRSGPLRLAVSRSHTPDWIQRFAGALGDCVFVPMGSVGFKVSLLLFGDADAYVHKPGLKEWDTCAPEAVARAAGWEVCRLDGSRQRYNQRDPRNDEIVVCRPWLRERVLAALALHPPAGG